MDYSLALNTITSTVGGYYLDFTMQQRTSAEDQLSTLSISIRCPLGREVFPSELESIAVLLSRSHQETEIMSRLQDGLRTALYTLLIAIEEKYFKSH
jgi:hypothetical protein